MNDTAVWHDDGHAVHLELNKTEVVVTSVTCPRTGACTHHDAPCVVEWFLMTYGLECNVGVCEVAPDIPIAWTLIGDDRSFDTCQVWVIPTSDFVYEAWAESEKSSSSSRG